MLFPAATFVGITLSLTLLARLRANAIAVEIIRQGWKKTIEDGKLSVLS